MLQCFRQLKRRWLKFDRRHLWYCAQGDYSRFEAGALSDGVYVVQVWDERGRAWKLYIVHCKLVNYKFLKYSIFNTLFPPCSTIRPMCGCRRVPYWSDHFRCTMDCLG